MTAAELATPTRAERQRFTFYAWSGVAMAAVAVVGFVPTFWLPVAQGVPERVALFAVHGMLCYAWIAFLIYQSWLAASGRVARHRDAGLIGVSLATALVLFGVMAIASAARRTITAGYADATEAFMIVPMAEMIYFTGFLIAAFLNLKRPEWHKRFMIAATVAILPAALARWYIVFVLMGGHLPPWNGTVGIAGLPAAPPQPVSTTPLIGLIPMETFIVAGMVHDWRKRAHVHPAYCWAGGIFLVFEFLKSPISETALWHHIAQGLLAVF
jgi:hypothetical protein